MCSSDLAKGAVKNQITKGECVVRKVLHVDEAKRQVWFMACGVVAGHADHEDELTERLEGAAGFFDESPGLATAVAPVTCR